MTLLAGSCTIAEDNSVSGTGLALAIAQATLAPRPDGATANQTLAQWCNLLAAAIVDHLVAEGVVSVTVNAGGLQRTPDPNNPNSPTAAPAAPVALTGTIT